MEIDLTDVGRLALPEQFVAWIDSAGLQEEFAMYWEVHPWRKTNGAVLADFAVLEAAPRAVFEAVAQFIRTSDQPYVGSASTGRGL